MARRPKLWAEIQNGDFGIPDEATHFRWSMATAVRKKMCDGGQLYQLSDEQDRPGPIPAGPVHIYPFVVEEGAKGAQAKVTPVPVKKDPGGGDPITHITVTFEKTDTSQDVTGQLTALLGDFGKLVAAPTKKLVQHIKRCEKKIDEQAEYIATNEGGGFTRLLRDNPEIVKEAAKIIFGFAETAGAALRVKTDLWTLEVKQIKELKSKEGELDVTPKQ